MAGLVIKRRTGEKVVMTFNGEEVEVEVLEIRRGSWALLQFRASRAVVIDRVEKRKRQDTGAA